MYIECDFAGTATLDLQAHRRMHNRLLKHWPTTVIDGVTVMDKLILWEGVVNESPQYKRIYNILGIRVEDLKANNWAGLLRYYMYFDVIQGTYDNVSNTQLTDYLLVQAPFTVESIPTLPTPVYDRSVWFTSELSYEPMGVSIANTSLTDAAILSLVEADPHITEYSLEDEHVLTSLALLDHAGVVFEREFRVTYRNLTTAALTYQTDSVNTAGFIKEANIEFKFRRKPVTDQIAYTTYLDSVRAAMYASVNGRYSSVNKQLLEVYHSIVPFIDDEVLYQGQYRLDGLQAMKSKVFNKTITARIKTGFKKKKVKAWKKFVTIVIFVIIVIFALLTAIPSGGASLTSIGAAATILLAGTLAMQGLAIIVAKRDPAWAAYLGKMSATLGVISAVFGVVNIIGNVMQQLGKEALKEAATQALKDAGKEVTKEAIAQTIANMSLQQLATITLSNVTMTTMQDALIGFVSSAWSTTTSFTMSSMLNIATKAFQVYSTYINPATEGVDEMQSTLIAQQKQMEDLTAPSLKDKIDYTFTSPFYNIYDFNETMQAIPYSMTQGRIDDTFNKYYDGTTSKVVYKGYVG